MEQQFGEFQAAMDKETKEFDLMGEQRGGAAGEYSKLCPVWGRERALHQYAYLIFVLGQYICLSYHYRDIPPDLR